MASLAVLLAALTTAVIGCKGTPAAPDTSGIAYAGPPVTVQSVVGAHVVTVQSPTPGWNVMMDRVVEAHGRREVFVSLRRPNPGLVYAQVVVEQNLATFVPDSEAVRVFARLLPHDVPADSGEPYSLAVDTSVVSRP